MDASYYPYVFLILGFSCASILLGLSIFSFAAPEFFARWFSPFYWITRQIFRENPGRWDQRFSYVMGAVFLFMMLSMQFILGGFVATLFFQLWTSPFAFLLVP